MLVKKRINDKSQVGFLFFSSSEIENLLQYLLHFVLQFKTILLQIIFLVNMKVVIEYSDQLKCDFLLVIIQI